jgi:hypothetical protein
MASNTTGNLIREGYGLNLYCRCGRHAAMSTTDMRKLPQDLSVPDLLARLKCKKCGRRGMAEARLQQRLPRRRGGALCEARYQDRPHEEAQALMWLWPLHRFWTITPRAWH